MYGSGSSSGSEDQANVVELLREVDDYDSGMTESLSNIEKGDCMKTVPKFCPTRWTARLSTLSALIAKYPTVLRALSDIYNSSTGDAKADASSYIRLMEDSQFLVALIVAQFTLAYLGPVTKSLQSHDCNLSDAYKDISSAKVCIGNARNNKQWNTVWQRIEVLSDSIGISIKKPRVADRQTHRANAGTISQTDSDYYRINVYFRFIDHILQQLNDRFTEEHIDVIAAQQLVPGNIENLETSHLVAIKKFYGKYLDHHEMLSLNQEVNRWVVHFRSTPRLSATEALANSNPSLFPTIHKILRIFLSIPVSSVACERSFSGLRRLKLWTRSSMSEDRLSGLAMLLLHRDTAYIPTAIDIFNCKSNWRFMSKHSS